MNKSAASDFWHEFFGFLKSRNFLIIVALVALYLGAVNLEEIKELIEVVKGLFQ